jgi:hypothetical protein
MFDQDRPIRELPGFCQGLEAAGVDDVRMVADLAWAGSAATSATALAVTERPRVGIGVGVPPPVVTGVIRPKPLRLSGRVSDGTILAEGVGPAGIAVGAGTYRGRSGGTGRARAA